MRKAQHIEHIQVKGPSDATCQISYQQRDDNNCQESVQIRGVQLAKASARRRLQHNPTMIGDSGMTSTNRAPYVLPTHRNIQLQNIYSEQYDAVQMQQ